MIRIDATSSGRTAMNRTRLLLAGTAAALLGLVAACGGGGTGGKTDTGSTQIKLAADWIAPDITWLPYVVSMDRGLYKDAGLDVTLIQPPDNSSSIKLVATNQAQIAQTTITDIVFAKQEGLPVVSIANESQTNNWGLFAKHGTPISVADLKGKRIGVFEDTFTKAMLPLILKSGGLTMDDIKPVTVADSTLPLLLAGKIDYSTNTTNFEAANIQVKTGQSASVMLAKDHGAPDMPIWLYSSNTKWLKDNGEAAKKFLAATRTGTKWASAHPDEAVAIYEKHFSMKPDETAQNLAQWKMTIPLLTAGHDYFTATDQQWTDFAQALVGAGQLKKALDPSEYYTNQYIG
jgi:putative hydroxymethylpyrimidine transport system substrate-binding protein